MKWDTNKCIAITNNKNICKKQTISGKLYCPIHDKKYINKNNVYIIKNIIKRELIKNISRKMPLELTKKEILSIHKNKMILSKNYTRCYICDNENKNNFTFDHIIPIVNKSTDNDCNYGLDNDVNLIVCCYKCNCDKSNKGLDYIISKITEFTTNKIRLNNKIKAIKKIYKYKPKLILNSKYKYILNKISFEFIDNIFNLHSLLINNFINYSLN